ncbi:MAG: hypothetical protein ACTILZ_06335 [Leuconostoc mesenteroides]
MLTTHFLKERKQMNKLAKLSGKVKIAITIVVVVIVAVIAVGVKKSTATMTPKQAFNSMVFETKGYVGTATVSPSNKSKAKAKNHKAYEAVALYEAKQAKLDTDIVKRTFKNESDGAVAFKTLQSGSTYVSDIYGNIKDSKQADFEHHMSNTKIDTNDYDVAKNGAKRKITLEDSSASPYFEKTSRKITLSGLKSKQQKYVVSNDFVITRYDQTVDGKPTYNIYYKTPDGGQDSYSQVSFSRKEIKALFNGQQPKTNETISFNMKTLAKGLYGNNFDTNKYDYTTKQGTVTMKVYDENDFVNTHENIN